MGGALAESSAPVLIQGEPVPGPSGGRALLCEVCGHARMMQGEIVAAAMEVRRIADELERVVPDELWPLPTYREMRLPK